MPPQGNTAPGALTGDGETINADVLNPTTTAIGMSAEIGQLVAAVCKVMAEVGAIEKTSASGLNYKFLSEEAMTTRLRGLLATAGLMIFPRTCRVIEREDYRTQKGAEMTRFLTRQTFMLAHTSGQWMEGETFGESSDSGDKCLNKCMTAAYKYFARETFAISGGDDPDFHGGDAVARGGRGRPQQGNNQNGHNGGQRQHNQQGGSGGGNGGNQQGQQSNPNPDAAGQQQVDAALEQRCAGCIGKIKAATEHAQVETLLRHAGTVKFTQPQAASIQYAAADRRTGFWVEAIAGIADLEGLDALQTGIGGYLQPWPALAEKVRAAAQARAEAIVAPQAGIAGDDFTPPPDGYDPFSNDPPKEMDF